MGTERTRSARGSRAGSLLPLRALLAQGRGSRPPTVRIAEAVKGGAFSVGTDAPTEGKGRMRKDG